ncbi:MAG: hypothetical protein ABIZ91_06580 [Gemmatimonadaceae bacterium]
MAGCRPFSLALAVAALLPAVTGAQSTRTLTKPDAELAEPFTNVGGVRELKDGRVLLINARDKIVQIADFKSGNAIKVGREGSGPGEYALPMRVLPLPGDSSAVYDVLNTRLLVVLPNGKAGGFITPEVDAGKSGGGMVRMGSSMPRFADSRGRLYWTGQPFSGGMGRGGPPKPADSVPVIRYDRATHKVDSLGWVRLAKNAVQSSGGAGNVRVMIGMANPFLPRDEWTVTPDGRVAVLRAPEYRVDWYGPNGKSSSAPIAYEKLKVTEKHKAQWRESRKSQVAMMVQMENGRRSVSTSAPSATAPDPGDWPDVMPPFLDISVLPAPNGLLWVARTREPNDNTPDYDVIDASGKVTMRVELPPRTRLVGVGNGVIYTVRMDEDDLQYLQRFRMQ